MSMKRKGDLFQDNPHQPEPRKVAPYPWVWLLPSLQATFDACIKLLLLI